MLSFTEDTLLWIILTFPKNKHSSHPPSEGAAAQECTVMADGESVIVGSETETQAASELIQGHLIPPGNLYNSKHFISCWMIWCSS